MKAWDPRMDQAVQTSGSEAGKWGLDEERMDRPGGYARAGVG